MRALVILMSVALWTPAMAQQGDFRLPTATEVFNLRSRCAELGQKILEGMVRGNNEAIISQASRYDARTNRCYVDLIVRTIDPTKPPNLFHRYLFYGQTKEILAEASIYNDRKQGQVLDKQHNPTSSTDNGWDDARQYIDQMMAEDRR